MQGDMVDKENVAPGRAGIWSQPRKGGRLGGALGGGGGGGGRLELRSKGKAGVLAPNSTLGNSGGLDSLEWLKERVKQLKLNGKNQPGSDLEARHKVYKLRSPLVDGQATAEQPSAGIPVKELGGIPEGRGLSSASVLSHSSPSFCSAATTDQPFGGISSKELGGIPEGREPSSVSVLSHSPPSFCNAATTDQPLGGIPSKELGGIPEGRGPSSVSVLSHSSPSFSNASVLQSRSSADQPERSYRQNHRLGNGEFQLPAANIGARDDPEDVVISPAERPDVSCRGGVVEVKVVQQQRITSPADSETKKGVSSSRSEFEQQLEVSRNSASDVEESEGKKVFPRDSSTSVRSRGLSSSSVNKRSEESQRDSQVSISHRDEVVAEWKFKLASVSDVNPEESVDSHGHRRNVREEVLRGKSPNVAQGASSLKSSILVWSEVEQVSKVTQIAATAVEASRFQVSQVQQEQRVCSKTHSVHKSPNIAAESIRSVVIDRLGTTYKRSPLLEEREPRISPNQELSAGGLGGGGKNVDVGQKVFPLFPLKYCGKAEHCANDYGTKKAKSPCRHGGNCCPADRAISQVGLSPAMGANMESSGWSRSSGLWGQHQARANPPPHRILLEEKDEKDEEKEEEEEEEEEEEDLKWNSSQRDMDITAGNPVSSAAHLSFEMTGASSSGSSFTPSLIGKSRREDDSVLVQSTSAAERQRPPSSEKPLFNPSSKSPDRISKRFKYFGRAARVPMSLKATTGGEDDENSSRSASKGEVLDRWKSSSGSTPVVEVGSGLVPAEVESCALSPEEVDKEVGWQLASEVRKRKADRDPSSGDGDISQIIQQHSNSSALKTGEQKDVDRRQSVGSLLRQPPGRVAVTEKDLHFPVKPAPAGTVKLQQLKVTKGGGSGYVSSERSSTSLPTKLRARPAVPIAARQSSSAKAESHSKEMGRSQASSYSRHRSVPDREVGHFELQSMGGGAGSSFRIAVSSLGGSQVQSLALVEADEHSDERSGTGRRGVPSARSPMDVKDGREPNGLPAGANKENKPPTPGNDLSSCLNSLSLEEKDMLDKAHSKTPLQNSLNNSSSSFVEPTSHSTTPKPFCVAPHTVSQSVRSLLATDSHSQNQAQNSFSPLGQGHRQDHAGNQVRSSLFLSEKPRFEQPNTAVDLAPKRVHKAQADLQTVPAKITQNSTSGGHLSSHSSSKQNEEERADPTPPKKLSENLHFVWVTGKRYQKLGKIGKGGSSEVYKVIDSDCNIYALKKINLKGRERRTALGFYQEIEYLERLRGKRNVVQLIDYEVTNSTVIMEDYDAEKIAEDACIYMVLEYGEIDLAGILSKKRKEMQESNELLDDNWLRFYWKHMLLAVKTIHEERIVHADLKPANFLLVKGELKLIDFGIAKAIQNDTTHIVRDSQVGTLNYMSPEAFMTNSMDEQGRTVKCGRASDIWSLGCILYQMVYGHTPFSQVESFYAKIQAVTSKKYKIEFPAIPDPWLLDVMKKCLTWDRYSRPQVTELLQHPFLRPELASVYKPDVE